MLCIIHHSPEEEEKKKAIGNSRGDMYRVQYITRQSKPNFHVSRISKKKKKNVEGVTSAP